MFQLLNILQVGVGGRDASCLIRGAEGGWVGGWGAAAGCAGCWPCTAAAWGLTVLVPCRNPVHAQAPDADTLEKFLNRLPLMFKVGGGQLAGSWQGGA